MAFLLSLPVLAWQVWLASGQTFWTDEQYSVHVAFANPWGAYLRGDTLEGNSSPLFFLLLKLFVTLAPYTPLDPVLWLRLLSVIPSWLAFLVFLRWSMRDNGGWRAAALGAGSGALFCFHPAFLQMQWQCRPYGLWMLATTVQAIQVTDVLALRRPFSLARWAAVSFALCATMPVAPVQIGAAWACLLLTAETRKHARNALLAALPSVALCLFWKSALKDRFLFAWPGWLEARHLVLANVKPKLIALPLAASLILGAQRRLGRSFFRVMAFPCLALVSSVFILALFFLFYRAEAGGGFEIPSRYFLFLFPVTLAMLTALWRSLPGTIGAIAYPVIAFSVVLGLGESHGWLGRARAPDPSVVQLKGIATAHGSADSCYCFSDPAREVPRHLSAELSLALLQTNRGCKGPYQPLRLRVDPNATHFAPLRLTEEADEAKGGILPNQACAPSV